MKYAIAAIALWATQATAQADPCTSVGDVAEQIMTHRQAGRAISQLMPLVDGNPLFIQMLLQAYQEPRFGTRDFQQREIEDFRNLWEIGCYQAMTEKGA